MAPRRNLPSQWQRSSRNGPTATTQLVLQATSFAAVCLKSFADASVYRSSQALESLVPSPSIFISLIKSVWHESPIEQGRCRTGMQKGRDQLYFTGVESSQQSQN